MKNGHFSNNSYCPRGKNQEKTQKEIYQGEGPKIGIVSSKQEQLEKRIQAALSSLEDEHWYLPHIFLKMWICTIKWCVSFFIQDHKTAGFP